MRWFALVCVGLRWFALVCAGLRYLDEPKKRYIGIFKLRSFAHEVTWKKYNFNYSVQKIKVIYQATHLDDGTKRRFGNGILMHSAKKEL